jgi:predicted transport protein
MPDIYSVAAARKRVAAAYKDWLKESYDTQLSEMGSKKTRDQLPAISASGTWADVGIQSKPLAWIVEFYRDDDNTWKATLPASNHPHRLGGSFNSKSPLQGVLSRVLPVARTSDQPRSAEPHPYWEWALSLIFPGRPVFQSRGSSGGVIELDPATGRLWSPIDDEKFIQPYVDSALFKLLPDDEKWSPTIDLTYIDATRALADFIHVSNAAPPATPSETDDEDETGEDGADTAGARKGQTMEYRMSRAAPELLVLMGAVSEVLKSEGHDVTEVKNQQYYAYRRTKTFATLEIYPRVQTIKLYLRVNPQSITLEPGFTRDMTGIAHFGEVGDLEVLIKSNADLLKAAALIARAYRETE